MDYLQTAVRYSPENAALRLDLAEAHLWEAEHSKEAGHRAAAVRQLLAARDLCPLMVQPHLKLAALRDEFSSSDSACVYLEGVATLLGPTDARLWFLRGGGEQAAGNEEAAWKCWRRSLELADDHLLDILKRLGDKPDPEAVVDRLLPDKAEMLVEAARQLYPDEADIELRRPFLQRAVKLLQQRSGVQAKDLHLRGRIQAGLGDPGSRDQEYTYRLALARSRLPNTMALSGAKALLCPGGKVERSGAGVAPH